MKSINGSSYYQPKQCTLLKGKSKKKKCKLFHDPYSISLFRWTFHRKKTRLRDKAQLGWDPKPGAQKVERSEGLK